MRKICPKCKGNGYHKEPISVNPFLGVISLGLISLIEISQRDYMNCKVCNGDGYFDD